MPVDELAKRTTAIVVFHGEAQTGPLGFRDQLPAELGGDVGRVVFVAALRYIQGGERLSAPARRGRIAPLGADAESLGVFVGQERSHVKRVAENAVEPHRVEWSISEADGDFLAVVGAGRSPIQQQQ